MPSDTPRPQVDREFTVTGKDIPGPKTSFASRSDLEPNAVYRVEGRGDFYTDTDGKVNFIETTYGSNGKLNAELQNPQPNTTYAVHPSVHTPSADASNAHIFKTDGEGRVTFAHTESLQPGDAYRSGSVTGRVGNLGGEAYEGGHTFGNFFGGGTEVTNLDPMLRAVNRGSGESFGNLERSWRTLLDSPNPPNIEVAVEKIFEGDSKVPTKFIVDYRIDGGRPMTKIFENVR
ncbi:MULTISPECIES: DNA/RNA non-specific endonuclease [Tsukamurella]|uniref:Type VII secretion system protein EssD-like domain-containing protein n=2 Tax=Tsukamurella TaxID=2060 RepID=A0A5C5RWW3_9ACTN|nr:MULTISPECIES: DNA/RNA non-specific endonuclease [Tsukamurella]NMD55856.1 hypothetical protein [Tsukamurella columbiensis]TWS27547.1 hypothetical protein FK530_17575 [Tsukamurella conjunctivitidis]